MMVNSFWRSGGQGIGVMTHTIINLVIMGIILHKINIVWKVNGLHDNVSDWLGESIIKDDSNGTYEEGVAEDIDNIIEATTMTDRKEI